MLPPYQLKALVMVSTPDPPRPPPDRVRSAMAPLPLMFRAPEDTLRLCAATLPEEPFRLTAQLRTTSMLPVTLYDPLTFTVVAWLQHSPVKPRSPASTKED